MLFCDYWEIFLHEYVEPNCKPATQRSYERIAKNHILPLIGQQKLIHISHRTLQNILIDKHKTLAHASVILIRSVMQRAFAYACEARIYRENPATYLRVPRELTPKEQNRIFTAEDIAALMNRFPLNHHFHAPLILAYYTGMRLGETLALRWSDINWDAAEIYIHATVYDHRGVGEIQPTPKTKNSIRYVPMPAALEKELKTIQLHQKQLFLAIGTPWSTNTTICTNTKAKLMISDDMRYFGQYCKATFGYGSFHTLRHTHATLLLESGEPLEEVSKHLGHSSVAITSKTYSHITPKRRQHMKAAIESVFRPWEHLQTPNPQPQTALRRKPGV